MSQATSQTITLLPLLTSFPHGARTHPVVDPSNAPVIMDGDWIILDPNVTEFENGALYMFREPVRDHVWHVTVSDDLRIGEKPALLFSVLNPAFQKDPTYRPGLACHQWARDHCMGRVVGIYDHKAYSLAEGLAARIKALVAERERLVDEEKRLRDEAQCEKWSERGSWEYTEREADNISGLIAEVEFRIVALQNALSAQRTLSHIVGLAAVA